MDGCVTISTLRQGLSAPLGHTLDPQWFLSSPFHVQIRKLADLMDFYVLSRPAKLTFVRKEPLDEFIAFPHSRGVERLVNQDCSFLSPEGDTTEAGNEWLFPAAVLVCRVHG
jgi:hypothetical protein